MPTIHELATPALLLDVDVLEGNLQRMAERCRALGVTLRPHIKTHKCIEIGQRQRALGASGITVSTLEEAWAFAAQDFDDLIWAFPVSPTRLDAVAKLNDRATLRVVADSHDAVERLEQMSLPLHVWLMVDCGYHRAGVDPDSPRATELAARLASSTHLTLDGILSHSGHAYRGPTPADVLAAAQEERDTMLRFADRLRAGGVEVPAISVGSTPAMSVIDHLDGITETRPGNYAFYDHTQVVLGSCTPRDCAATVLATVVSSQPGAAHSVTDAGALALSKDPGHPHAPTASMGEIYEDYRAGTLLPDTRMISLSQEHGMLNASLRVGSTVRILPNHSCLTVACFDRYHVVRGEEVIDQWSIHRERQRPPAAW